MSMNFKEFIETDRERANTQKFEGTFLEYLDIVNILTQIYKKRRAYKYIKLKKKAR